MSVRCQITLPGWARVNDVAKVIGVLAGAEATMGVMPGSDECVVDGVSVGSFDTGGLAGCARIEFLLDGEPEDVMYHFEWDEPDVAGRGLLPSSTPFWCAVGKRLVEFFGGSVGYMDWDNSTDVVVWPKDPTLYRASNGDAWDDLQRMIHNIQPVTRAEYEAARSVAAYADAPIPKSATA